MEKLEELISLYTHFWQEAKTNLDKARENTSLKINRERVIKETTRKECYAEIINHLEGIKKSVRNF